MVDCLFVVTMLPWVSSGCLPIVTSAVKLEVSIGLLPDYCSRANNSKALKLRMGMAVSSFLP